MTAPSLRVNWVPDRDELHKYFECGKEFAIKVSQLSNVMIKKRVGVVLCWIISRLLVYQGLQGSLGSHRF